MDFRAGQQVCLIFSKDVTGTVSMVRDGKVSVTWNHAERGRPRTRTALAADVAQRVLVKAG